MPQSLSLTFPEPNPLSTGQLFFGALFVEGGFHLVLLDTRRGVAALIKILLFGAIAHHAGMGNVSWLLDVLRNCGFIRHIKTSERERASLNGATGVWFLMLQAANELDAA